MSMRDFVFSVTSIEPIRDAVASGNEALVRALVAEYNAQYSEEDLRDEVVQEDIDAHRSIAERFLTCAAPPEEEPGAWSLLLEDVARHLGLAPRSDLPFNEGWKHTYCWRTYRKAVDGHISRQSRTILESLDDGRPLRGTRIDYDGCQFAWLTTDEVWTLHGSLAQLDAAVLADTGLAAFHETLVESLRRVGAEGRDLILGSC